MARTRQLKPDFFADEDLAACSPHARLLFAGLWTLCDRAGRLEDRPPKLRVQIFPYEPDVDLDELLEELARPKAHGYGALVTRYTADDGRRYLQVNGFCRHQKCHPKEPPSQLPAPGKVTAGSDPTTASREKPRLAVVGHGETVSSKPVPSVPSKISESEPSVPSESEPAASGDARATAAPSSCLDHDPDNPLELSVVRRCEDLARKVAGGEGRDPTAGDAEDVLEAVSTTSRGKSLESIRGAPRPWLEATLRACDDFERDLDDGEGSRDPPGRTEVRL